MKKIGFIDNFLSEAHANSYPAQMRAKSLFQEQGMEICYAYARIEVSPYDGVTTDEWCQKHGVKRCNSIEELVSLSDFIVVLSPDNPELHEMLAELPLKSGKPTYIDKTFAPDKAAAERMFALAKQYRTPMYSSSSLRFADELKPYRLSKEAAASAVVTGPYLFDIYAIHIFEMMVTVMKSGAKRMMAVTNTLNRTLVVEYDDGRRAVFSQIQASTAPFAIAVEKANGVNDYYTVSDTFSDRFIDAMVMFFATGEAPVSAQETIDLMGMLQAARKALASPFSWLEI